MSAAIIGSAIAKAITWVAKRGKGVSKHISHHTRSAANAAKRNPRYLPRVLGKKAHSIFRDPKPKKLIEAALRQPSAKELRPNGIVWVEKEFDRAIGKQGETIIRIWIDPRTGRIITAFPVAKSFAAAVTLVAVPTTAFGESLEVRVETAVQGMETIAAQWHQTRKKTKEAVAAAIIEFLLAAAGLDSTDAGDPDELLHIKLENYLDQQAWALVGEFQEAARQTFAESKQQELRQQFRDAVVGAVLGSDEEE